MKLNTLLTNVMTKLGVDTTSPESQKILGNPNLANIEVADEISNKLDGEFFTKDAAIANTDIRSRIRAEALNGVDASVLELIKGYDFDQETQSEILKEDKTHNKIKKVMEKIEDLTRKKSKASGVDKETLNTEIEKLNKQVLSTKAEYENKLNDERNARRGDKINWELDSIYKGFDYSLQSDKDISITAAKAIIGDFVNKKGLKFESSENGLQILTKDGTEYYENSVKLSPADFIKKSLFEAKMLKVNDMTQTSQPNKVINTGNGTVNTNSNTNWRDAMDAKLRSYEDK